MTVKRRRYRMGFVGWIIPLLVTVLLANMAPAPVVAAEGLTGIRVITAASGTQTRPRTDGATVIWTDYRNDPAAGDIYGESSGGGAEIAIATGPGDQRNADIDGGIVVWQEAAPNCAPNCQYGIRGVNLANGQRFDVATGADDDEYPAIAGNLVVWISKRADGSEAIQARDLGTMAPTTTLTTTPNANAHLAAVTIDGSRVVWVEDDVENTLHWRMVLSTLGTGASQVVAEGNGNWGTIDPAGIYRAAGAGLDLRGDILVYTRYVPMKTGASENALSTINLRSGARLTFEGGGTSTPTTDGRYVFWVAFQPGQDRRTLTGYDVQTQSRFTILADTPNGPATRGGVLVWVGGIGADIYGGPVSAVLPTGPRDPPTATSPDRAFFPETNHSLASGFKAFWDRSGGLPVFGYPLTEEYDEANPDTGKVDTVQYFERQRFEYHPENAGSPYETLLGRLGVAAAQQAGLLGTAPFQPVAAGINPNCSYVPETGHHFCSDFRAYWQAHGLEFGDPGVSYRESLALFGYPISDEFMQNGMTVQYFERAVFEYHPENPEPYRVLLRRLGAEVLAQRGS